MPPRIPTHSRLVRWALLVATAGTALFALLPVTPPWQVRLLYASVCHQKAERTLTLLGEPMAVCSRCAGLYFGAAVAVFLAAWMPRVLWWPHRFWFFAALLPTAIDATLPWLGLPQLTLVPRHFVAWPAGFAAGWFFALGIAFLVTNSKVTLEKSVEVGDG